MTTTWIGLPPSRAWTTFEHGKGSAFRERLLRSVTEAGTLMDSLLSGRQDAWATQLIKDRNDMAHHKGIRLDDYRG